MILLHVFYTCMSALITIDYRLFLIIVCSTRFILQLYRFLYALFYYLI